MQIQTSYVKVIYLATRGHNCLEIFQYIISDTVRSSLLDLQIMDQYGEEIAI